MKIKRKHFAPGTLVAPVPPAMVTVGDFDNANIITIAWTGILNSQPPKTYVSIRPSRHSYGILKEKGEFVINLPSVGLARETDYVGIYTGAKVDKWAKTGLTKAKSEKVSPPTIAECPIAIECRVSEVIPMGSHDVFMADIVDENGKMHFDRADLLAYAHGEYYELGEVVGRFGFSTDKPKKAVEPEKKPFYENAPRGKSAKKKPTDKNKGAPHGRRVKK